MSDEPTLWELQRAIEAGQREVREDIAHLHARLDHFVLKEVYEAHRQADQDRMRRMEAEQTSQRETMEAEQATQREAVRKAIWTAISSFVAPVIVGIVLAVVLGGGEP